MSVHVRRRLRTKTDTVLDWLMIAVSFMTIAWISFKPIGG